MKRARRWVLTRVLMPALLALAAGTAAHYDWLWRLDLLAFDAALRSLPRGVPQDVVLVGIDEASLHRLGRWPWRRSIHADLVDRLTAAGVRGIALDIAFTEPHEDDARLAEAMRASGRVVLPVLHEEWPTSGTSIETLPVPELAEAAAALGHVDVEVDPDGLVRAVFLEAGLGRPAWPQMSLAMLRLAPSEAPAVLPGARDTDSTPPSPFYWMRDHRVLLRFSGAPGRYRRVSYIDVLDGRVPPEVLRNAYTFVGPMASGLGEQIPTPVSGIDRPMSGIEFNANVLAAVRDGDTLDYLSLPLTVALTAGLVFAAAFGLASLRRHVRFELAALVVVAVAAWGLLATTNRWFTPAAALLGVLVSYPAAIWRWRTQVVERDRTRARVALGSLAEGVVMADALGFVDYLNPVAQKWIGGDAAIGRPLSDILQVTGMRSHADLLSDDGVPVDAALLTPGGNRLPVRASMVSIGKANEPRLGTVVALMQRDPAGSVRPARPGAVAVGEAVERTQARGLLEMRLTRLLEHTPRGNRVAVLAVDIVRLRHVNVAFGRKGGDALLAAVGERLRGAIREREAVTHIGGDEFVILFGDLGRSADAVALASRLIAVFERPFSVEGVEVRVGATVGVSLYPEHGTDAETLLQRAETAESWARDHGQSHVQLYGPHMSAPAMDRIVLERALQAALENDELHLAYQPQVEMSTGAVVGAEALVRWHHPQYGSIPASAVISLAEDSNLIGGLGDWVLRAGCRQLADWRDRGLPPIRLAVNVSPQQFATPGLAESIDRTLHEFALEPSLLEVEITENVLVRDVDRARASLEQIKSLGVGIALDDFGVGYSSLGYLSRFPVDCVKIDRSFVGNVTVDGHNRTICLAVLAMAQSMQRRVIAEGVETRDQMQFFAEKGCDVVQGYYISKPVEAHEVERLLRDDVRFRTT